MAFPSSWVRDREGKDVRSQSQDVLQEYSAGDQSESPVVTLRIYLLFMVKLSALLSTAINSITHCLACWNTWWFVRDLFICGEARCYVEINLTSWEQPCSLRQVWQQIYKHNCCLLFPWSLFVSSCWTEYPSACCHIHLPGHSAYHMAFSHTRLCTQTHSVAYSRCAHRLERRIHCTWHTHPRKARHERAINLSVTCGVSTASCVVEKRRQARSHAL